LGFQSRPIQAIRLDGDTSYGLVFACSHRLATLANRGYLTLFDSTHKTNILDWYLFTYMVRIETSDWLPCAHALVSAEDGDIIAEGSLDNSTID
jgi:hypothetical protein